MFSSAVVLFGLCSLVSRPTSSTITTVQSTVVTHEWRASLIVVSPSLTNDVDQRLLFVTNSRKILAPHNRRSSAATLVVLLLLRAGVESNPGPAAGESKTKSPNIGLLNFGHINICSARDKVAAMHDLIAEFSLDFLALSETRLQADKHAAIKNDVAPDGYDVTHVHRPATANHPSGGGLTLVYRHSFSVKPHPIGSTLSPSTFELQLLQVASVRPPLSIVNVKCPQFLMTRTSTATFERRCEKLAYS